MEATKYYGIFIPTKVLSESLHYEQMEPGDIYFSNNWEYGESIIACIGKMKEADSNNYEKIVIYIGLKETQTPYLTQNHKLLYDILAECYKDKSITPKAHTTKAHIVFDDWDKETYEYPFRIIDVLNNAKQEPSKKQDYSKIINFGIF